MIPIAGVQPFTTIDFPGVLSCVVFTQGCPWKCRYCQNIELQAFSPQSKSQMSWTDLLKFLRSRRSFLDAVVVSGGEPTAHKQLAEAFSEIRSLGYKTGLHTAGIYPDRFKSILSYVDWVGFDLKAPLDDRYDQITQVKNSADAVRKSLDFLLASGVPAQFRCTYHPLLLNDKALSDLRELLLEKGIRSPLVLQDFRSQGCRDLELNEWPNLLAKPLL